MTDTRSHDRPRRSSRSRTFSEFDHNRPQLSAARRRGWRSCPATEKPTPPCRIPRKRWNSPVSAERASSATAWSRSPLSFDPRLLNDRRQPEESRRRGDRRSGRSSVPRSPPQPTSRSKGSCTPPTAASGKSSRRAACPIVFMSRRRRRNPPPVARLCVEGLRLNHSRSERSRHSRAIPDASSPRTDPRRIPPGPCDRLIGNVRVVSSGR